MALLLSNDACYQALASRDARFDGQFIVAVSSTGIYCRPICRVRIPKQQNCQFFESPAQAESKGFRPCLRCRPELATRWCTESISETLAEKAIQWIDAHITDADVLSGAQKKIGVSDRHLRRLLQEHLGVSPLQYVQTSRLLLAKQLLTDTDVPIGDIAFIAGFNSIRRFNTVLKTSYGLTPSDLRKSRRDVRVLDTSASDGSDDSIRCVLSVVSPYDFSAMLGFHERRAINSIESVIGNQYTRSISLENSIDESPCVGWYRVASINDTKLQLNVSRELVAQLPRVISIVRAQFDLDANPNHWLGTLGDLAQPNPGLRVPGGVDGFEVAVRAILGQQITVEAATTLLNRVVEKLGDKGPHGGPSRCFPTANKLSRTKPETLGKLGVIESRARAIRSIAKAVCAGELQLHAGADIQHTRTLLKAIPGVGDWTINYILMRAVRWPDAFIHTDLGIVKAASKQGIDDILTHADRWRPWRGYAAMHLWHSLTTEQEVS